MATPFRRRAVTTNFTMRARPPAWLFDASIANIGSQIYDAYICAGNLGPVATNTPTYTPTPTPTGLTPTPTQPTPTSTPTGITFCSVDSLGGTTGCSAPSTYSYNFS